MGKILFWLGLILVIVAGVRLVAILQRRQRAAQEAQEARERRDEAARASRDHARAVASEAMQRCDHCGVHAPASEMIVAGGRYYCCPEHRDADR
jgi:uncharacterized protein